MLPELKVLTGEEAVEVLEHNGYTAEFEVTDIPNTANNIIAEISGELEGLGREEAVETAANLALTELKVITGEEDVEVLEHNEISGEIEGL